MCSGNLSRGQESNLQHPHYKCGALPLKLPRHKTDFLGDNAYRPSVRDHHAWIRTFPGLSMSRRSPYSWDGPRLYHFHLWTIIGLFHQDIHKLTREYIPKKQLHPSALITALLPGWLDFLIPSIIADETCCPYGAYAYLGYIIETKSCASYHLAEDAEYQPAPTNW